MIKNACKTVQKQRLSATVLACNFLYYRLTPGKDNILGVGIPKLRKMAIEIAKGDWRTYLSEAKDDTMEEAMLQGMVIGYCKADVEETLS